MERARPGGRARPPDVRVRARARRARRRRLRPLPRARPHAARAVPVGPRADPRLARAVPRRGDVRAGRRAAGPRPRRSGHRRGPRRGARRPAVPDRVPRHDRRAGRALLDRRRHRAASTTSSCAGIRTCSATSTPTTPAPCSPTGSDIKRGGEGPHVGVRRRRPRRCRRSPTPSSSCARRPRSASTGPTSTARWPRSTRSWPSCGRRSPTATPSGSPTSSATSSSPSSTSPATSGVDAELAVRAAAGKFRRRFEAVEALAARARHRPAAPPAWRRSTPCGTRSSEPSSVVRIGRIRRLKDQRPQSDAVRLQFADPVGPPPPRRAAVRHRPRRLGPAAHARRARTAPPRRAARRARRRGDRTSYVVKELPDHLALRGVPPAARAGRGPPADGRSSSPSSPSASGGRDGLLITRHLDYSLPYRTLLSGRGLSIPYLGDRLLDALVGLLVRLHLAGFFWGDCSLSNALFRRDAGALQAYIIDVETSERYEQLTDGQRQMDLDIATENVAGGLLDLQIGGRLDRRHRPVRRSPPTSRPATRSCGTSSPRPRSSQSARCGASSSGCAACTSSGSTSARWRCSPTRRASGCGSCHASSRAGTTRSGCSRSPGCGRARTRPAGCSTTSASSAPSCRPAPDGTRRRTSPPCAGSTSGSSRSSAPSRRSMHRQAAERRDLPPAARAPLVRVRAPGPRRLARGGAGHVHRRRCSTPAPETSTSSSTGRPRELFLGEPGARRRCSRLVDGRQRRRRSVVDRTGLAAAARDGVAGDRPPARGEAEERRPRRRPRRVDDPPDRVARPRLASASSIEMRSRRGQPRRRQPGVASVRGQAGMDDGDVDAERAELVGEVLRHRRRRRRCASTR